MVNNKTREPEAGDVEEAAPRCPMLWYSKDIALSDGWVQTGRAGEGGATAIVAVMVAELAHGSPSSRTVHAPRQARCPRATREPRLEGAGSTVGVDPAAGLRRGQAPKPVTIALVGKVVHRKPRSVAGGSDGRRRPCDLGRWSSCRLRTWCEGRRRLRRRGAWGGRRRGLGERSAQHLGRGRPVAVVQHIPRDAADEQDAGSDCSYRPPLKAIQARRAPPSFWAMTPLLTFADVYGNMVSRSARWSEAKVPSWSWTAARLPHPRLPSGIAVARAVSVSRVCSLPSVHHPDAAPLPGLIQLVGDLGVVGRPSGRAGHRRSSPRGRPRRGRSRSERRPAGVIPAPLCPALPQATAVSRMSHRPSRHPGTTPPRQEGPRRV